jgi:hypothetical protein
VVRKSVQQQEALRRARERQRARESAETKASEGPRVPEAMLNRPPTETDRRRGNDPSALLMVARPFPKAHTALRVPMEILL